MKEKRKESLGNSVWKEMEEEKEKAFGNRRRALNSCDHMLLSLANFQHMSCYLLGEISLTFCKISVPKLSSFSYQHPSLSRLIVQVLWIIIKFHLIPEQISIIKIRMLKINTIS